MTWPGCEQWGTASVGDDPAERQATKSPATKSQPRNLKPENSEPQSLVAGLSRGAWRYIDVLS